jgi:hypothetical protein
MEKTASLTVKLPVATHKKLKMLSIIEEKSMTEMLIEWIDEKGNNIPDGLLSKPIKEKLKRRKYVKAVKIDQMEIQKTILKYHDEKMSLQKIADKLNADGVPTLSGKGKWARGTIGKKIKAWDMELGNHRSNISKGE